MENVFSFYFPVAINHSQIHFVSNDRILPVVHQHQLIHKTARQLWYSPIPSGLFLTRIAPRTTRIGSILPPLLTQAHPTPNCTKTGFFQFTTGYYSSISEGKFTIQKRLPLVQHPDDNTFIGSNESTKKHSSSMGSLTRTAKSTTTRECMNQNHHTNNTDGFFTIPIFIWFLFLKPHAVHKHRAKRRTKCCLGMNGTNKKTNSNTRTHTRWQSRRLIFQSCANGMIQLTHLFSSPTFQRTILSSSPWNLVTHHKTTKKTPHKHKTNQNHWHYE